MWEAMYYEKIKDQKVQCHLCPHNCSISQNMKGICGVRKNVDGILHSLNYGKITSMAQDPIEKKPLYHFYPGSDILSVGSFGCNFRCSFCQNWQIAQRTDIPAKYIAPSELIKIALSQKNNIGIAYTYNEPSIWYEYVYESSKLAKNAGLVNVLVTNGFIEKKPLKDILPYIDAMNIDVKAFNEDFYKKHSSGSLAPVKETVDLAQKHCHVEITTLLIPGLNDDESTIVNLSKWISSLSKDIPLHLTRYFPNYQLDISPTPTKTVYEARDIASKYLNYVYVGNIATSIGNNTYCPQCGMIVIRRQGYKIASFLENRRCKHCGNLIPIKQISI